jgi:hypothetical protein
MHLIDSTNILLDPDGMDIPVGAIPDKALFTARDCMADDVKDGRLDLHYRIEVQDERGQAVHCLEFADAYRRNREAIAWT